ncbi:hypothetical protein HY212_07465 [Candidatus Pacearchaeota archaeon]|nr:hypothetical protein [Candidatus Pacearchaeota archaeon]
MSFNVGGKFIVGINQGWFENKYGHDLGSSEFNGEALWSYPLSAPLTVDLSKPNPSQDQPYLSQHPEAIDQYFSKINGVGVVRLWLFEKLEGLVFSKDGNNSLMSLDQSFIDNLLKILDSANKYNIKVYLTLFNSWDTNESPPAGLPHSRIGDYTKLFLATKQIIIRILQNPSDFCDNILIPLLDAIKNNSAVYAIDLINEPESMTESNMTSSSQLRNFVEYTVQKIKPYGIKVSIGCMRKNMSMSLSTTMIDFSDVHAYNNPVNPSPEKLDLYNSSDFAGKYCIIGECGYHPSTNPYDQNQELPVLQGFLEVANKQGYAGALAWRFQDYKNPDGIIQIVKNFINTNPTIQSKPKQGCFIATASMDSEIHPHVQFLREYRDSILLKSSHREQFEKILDYYYRFSPPIAEAMKRDKHLKHAIKYIIVYPIVLSLKILVLLFGNKLKE